MSEKDLATLIRKHPRLIGLLHKHGIHFCAGCYLTLSSPPERAAAYHGVPDVKKFLKEVEAVVGKRSHRHSHHHR